MEACSRVTGSSRVFQPMSLPDARSPATLLQATAIPRRRAAIGQDTTRAAARPHPSSEGGNWLPSRRISAKHDHRLILTNGLQARAERRQRLIYIHVVKLHSLSPGIFRGIPPFSIFPDEKETPRDRERERGGETKVCINRRITT